MPMEKAGRTLYGDALIGVERVLYECGAEAVGMSSLGPSLFFVAGDMKQMVEKAKSLLPKCQFYITKTNNEGRIIHYD